VGQHKNALGLIKTATPPMSMLVNGSVLKDKQLAEAISDSFYRVSSDIPPLHFQPIPVTCIPDLYIISPEAVEARLSCIKERKATGPDEIPNWLLKSCAVNLRSQFVPFLMRRLGMAKP
jgi:hypothetical protein